MLHEKLLYPYHIQRTQALTPSDYQTKIEFSQWLLVKCVSNPNFVACILFTDKATFMQNKITNFHNDYTWTDKSSRIYLNKPIQHRFLLNVWTGIKDEDYFIGPKILPN